jgi:5,10-methylene-tetrahydrofolate dehydrogenase/methenyl tetrahydrofolate cyclohydrolase
VRKDGEASGKKTKLSSSPCAKPLITEKRRLRMSLKGKYALITGSSRGIGRGIALKLAEPGVKVAINYCRNEVALGHMVTLRELLEGFGKPFFDGLPP